MIIANIMLADEVLSAGQDNQTLVNGPNSVFPVLSTPAYLSIGALLVISGLDLTKPNNLSLEIKSSSEDNPRAIMNSPLPKADDPSKDPESVTFTANLSLKKVVINDIGLHEMIVKINGNEVTKTSFNVIKNDE